MTIKRILFLFLIFGVQLNLYSQRIDNKIVTRNTTIGMQYFILPQSGFQSKGSSLTFDQTTFVGKDTVRIGITLRCSSAINPDSLIVSCDDEILKTYQIEPEFVEFKKRKWESRIFISATQLEMIHLFNLPTPPKILVKDKMNSIELNIKNARWSKYREINTAIFQQIKFNEN